MKLHRSLIRTLVAIALAGIGLAQAASPRVEQLPRVVISGKSSPAVQQQIAQLPRVVIEGRATLPGTLVAARSSARRG